MTALTTDLNEVLATNYLLVTCTISDWSGKASDKALADETAATHGAAAGALRVVKDLMVGADAELKALRSAQSAVRSFAYDRTIPFSYAGEDAKSKRGPRALPVADAMTFLAELKPLNAAYKAALDDFERVYTQRVAQARGNLGSIDDPAAYPDPSVIRDEFSVRVDLLPMPSVGSFNKLSLPAQVAQALGDRLAARQETALKAGFADLRDRIAAELQRTVAQLGKVVGGEQTRLYKTLQTNVAGLAGLLRSTAGLLGDTPELARVLERLDTLARTPVETYKTSVGKANDNLVAAKEALDGLDEIQWF